jgi:CheY-like chemotaxis protein
MLRLLKGSNYDVEWAATVEAALAAADVRRFDLLVSDLGLPDGSGVDLMRRLRAKYDLRGIALSGYGMEEDVQNSRAAGFAAHLTKPINLHALQRAIESAVSE